LTVISLFRHIIKNELLLRPEGDIDGIKWLISIEGGELQATDPKDHIYWFVSLRKIDIDVNYSLQKSVGDVYRDYISVMLKLRPQGLAAQRHQLFLLHYAGIGMYEINLVCHLGRLIILKRRRRTSDARSLPDSQTKGCFPTVLE
jgi:hypothetical protein